MSFILHGDLIHYRTLKRLKNKHVAQQLSIKNRPYFINVESHFVSQYRMSSGECLLVSLLHFLYNSIVRRSLPSNQKVLVLIDELELALHPVAVLRLMDFLKQLVKEHSNLIIYLSSHSPEVIRTISPSELFKVTNNNGNLTIEANCYPSYLIRDLYSNVSPDFLFCNIIIRQLMRFFKSSLAETGTKIDVPCRQTVIIMPSYAGVTSRCASWRSSSAWLPCSVLAMCEV